MCRCRLASRTAPGGSWVAGSTVRAGGGHGWVGRWRGRLPGRWWRGAGGLLICNGKQQTWDTHNSTRPDTSQYIHLIYTPPRPAVATGERARHTADIPPAAVHPHGHSPRLCRGHLPQHHRYITDEPPPSTLGPLPPPLPLLLLRLLILIPPLALAREDRRPKALRSGASPVGVSP